MATESKQIDGVVDDPENGGLKSGPCLTDRTHALPSALAIRLKNSDNSKSATSVRSHSPDLRSTDTFHFMASPSKPS